MLINYVYEESKVGIFKAGHMEQVKSITQSAPPGSPATGDHYILPASPSGAWSGHGKEMAAWNGSSWEFSYSAPGLRGRTFQADDTSLVWRFDASNDPFLFASDAIEIIFNGGGAAITTSHAPMLVTVPFPCRIAAWQVIANASGSIVVDVQRAAFGSSPSFSSIAASAKPTLSSAQTARDETLTGWTKTLAKDDLLKFVVDSAATVQVATVTLKIQEIVPNFNG
jgi:hypothetical protein